jgi:hypothetical protein
MDRFKANASVIFTDGDGRKIDTFVIFDTELSTGLTHINHENLKVPGEQLMLHPKTACADHLPIDDAFSFEMIRKLREKYQVIDADKTRKHPEMYLIVNRADTQTGSAAA